MRLQKNLINELEDAISHKDIAHRAETLRRLTDLFVLGAPKYTGEQIELFDEVLRRIVEEVDVSARAAFGNRLAPLPNAPPKTMRHLAFDNAIEVAGPVLTHSQQLDDRTLVENAKTKSQDHLLAISRRRVLPEEVTDVLVERGNPQVALSTAENPGAAFSEFGYATLVRRSQDDAKLAMKVWARMDIPRRHLLRLFAEASESVRLTLEATDRRKTHLIRDMVAQASNNIQTTMREESASFVAARALVEKLNRAGRLDERQLAEFARAGKFDETVIALSMLCELSIGPIERAFAQNWSDQILVLAKAIDLSWDTTKQLLMLQADAQEMPAHGQDDWFASFIKLQPDTAKKALQFYRLRERAVLPVSY